MRVMSRLCLMVMALMLAGLVTACASPEVPSEAAPPVERIRVVMDNNYPPYVFEDAGGNIQGILIDQWALWEQKTGVQVDIVTLPWNEALEGMKSGQYDVIDTIFYTEERAALFDFSEPYADISVRIFFNANISGISQVEDLKGFRVAVKTGDANAEYLVERGLRDLVYYDSYEAIVGAAARDEESIFVIDQPPGQYFLYKFGVQDKFRLSDPLYGGQFHRAVMKGDSDMLSLVRNGFESISPSEYQAIENRWFGTAYGNFVTKFMPYVWLGLGLAAVVIFGLFFFNRILQNQVHYRTLELQRSEARFKEAIEFLPIPISISSQQGQVLLVNRKFSENYGYTRDEMPTVEAWMALAYPDPAYGKRVRKIWEQDVMEAVSSGSSTPPREYKVTCKDGSVCDVEIIMHAVGETWITTFNNVSARKRTEEALHNSEANYRSLVELSPDAIIVHCEGRIVFANSASVKLIGANEVSDILGKSTLDFVHSGSREVVQDRIMRMLTRGEKVPLLEEKFIKMDGSLLDVEVVAMPITYEGNLAVQVVVRDITERKKIIDALKASEEKYRTLIETINTGIFMSTLDGHFVQANSMVVEMGGYDNVDEFIGIPAANLYADPEDRELIMADLRDTGHVKNREVRSVKKDGTIFWVAFSAILIEGRNGEPGYLLGSVIDITDRKNAQDIVQKSEKRWRALIENSADALTLLNSTGMVMYEGPTVQRLTGYPSSERVGQNAFEHLHPDDFALVKAIFGKVMASPGASQSAVFRSRHRDGHYWWVEATATNLLNDPDVQAIVVNYRDISARKQAEDELKDSENRFRILFEHAGMGVAQADTLTGQFIRVNQRYCDIVGYSRDELAQMSYQSITHPDDLQEDFDNMARMRSGELHGFTMEKRYIRKDGSQVWVVLVVSPLWQPNEPPGTHIGVIHDITEQKRAEYALRNSEAQVRKLNADLEVRVAERTAQLEMTNRELESFAYSVSHDLRAPLRAIDGFSRILLDDYAQKLDEDGRFLLERLRTANRNLTQLVDALLGLSRMTRAELRCEQVNLGALAESIAENMRQIYPERQALFTCPKEVFAHGDVRLLTVALENLLDNAWKFTAKCAQPAIEFGTVQRDNETLFFVRDNGAGFDMSHAGRLFGAFQRLHADSDFEGAGIGLATVQRIIHRHGGRIWAESEVDKGATFYFTLG